MKLYEILGIGGNALGFGGGSGGTGTVSFASGGTTINVLPKSNGAGLLVDSTVTDNGTNVIFTEMVFVPTGGGTSTTATSIGGSASNGIDFSGANQMRFICGGLRGGGFSNTQELILGSVWKLAWSATSNDAFGSGSDLSIGRRGTANLQLGKADVNGVPVAQTLSVQNAITGSNLAAANFTIDAGLGTGTGLVGTFVVRGADSSVATGTTAQTSIVRCVLNATKALTTGAATTLVSIPLASLQMTGGYVSVYMEATDGTNQATRCEEIYYAAENSAGVFVTSAGVVGTGVTAATATKTLTATYALTSANPALLQVTPTLTGIIATRFTCIYEVHHMGNTQPTV